jgi:mono/diheme cytochrome c family protein
MKLYRSLTAVGAGVFTLLAGLLQVPGQPSNITTTPVYVPDYTHAGEPLPNGVIDWDAVLKSVDATDGDQYARFTFSFTNVARATQVTRTTNLDNTASPITSVTNFTPVNVTILNVHPSCGCTTAELPPTPWTLPPGVGEQMKVKVDLAGKSGTLFKQVTVTTDHGMKNLMLRINLHPAPVVMLTDEQKMAGIAAAKVDRQAVFRGDCASCHNRNLQGKFGPQLFAAACGICHEAENRATMVPDLNKLKVATNNDFWRTWITYGKPGSLMPAFASSQGGPLSDLQVASLAGYLNQIHSSPVPAPAAH